MGFPRSPYCRFLWGEQADELQPPSLPLHAHRGQFADYTTTLKRNMPSESGPRLPASATEPTEASSHPKKDHSQLEEASNSVDSHVEFPEERRKKLVRSLDWILIPQITFLYLVAYLDRGNSR